MYDALGSIPSTTKETKVLTVRLDNPPFHTHGISKINDIYIENLLHITVA
jgi:hypothetical protein